MFKGVEFRLHQRRLSKSKYLKLKPEAFVALCESEKVWVRDNNKGGLMYSGDEGKVIGQQRITSWLPAFEAETTADRDRNVKARLDPYAEAHAKGVIINASTTPGNNGSDTRSDKLGEYMAAGSDQELLRLYGDDDSVPDEVAATLIGEAQGRVSAGGLSIPSSMVIEIKRIALKCRVSP